MFARKGCTYWEGKMWSSRADTVTGQKWSIIDSIMQSQKDTGMKKDWKLLQSIKSTARRASLLGHLPTGIVQSVSVFSYLQYSYPLVIFCTANIFYWLSWLLLLLTNNDADSLLIMAEVCRPVDSSSWGAGKSAPLEETGVRGRKGALSSEVWTSEKWYLPLQLSRARTLFVKIQNKMKLAIPCPLSPIAWIEKKDKQIRKVKRFSDAREKRQLSRHVLCIYFRMILRSWTKNKQKALFLTPCDILSMRDRRAHAEYGAKS